MYWNSENREEICSQWLNRISSEILVRGKTGKVFHTVYNYFSEIGALNASLPEGEWIPLHVVPRAKDYVSVREGYTRVHKQQRLVVVESEWTTLLRIGIRSVLSTQIKGMCHGWRTRDPQCVCVSMCLHNTPEHKADVCRYCYTHKGNLSWPDW